LLEVDAAVADAIRRTDFFALDRLVARLPGFTPLVQRALQLAIDGLTSVDEAMRTMSGLEELDRRSSLLDDVLTSRAGESGSEPGVAAASL
jgi:hypothetical protein